MPIASLADISPTRLPRRLLAHLAPIFSAILLALCFPPFEWTLLAWVALIPFCWAIFAADDPWFLFPATYLGGEIYYWIGMDFLRTAMVNGSGAGLTWHSGIYATAWAAQGLALGFTWVAAMWIARRLVHRLDWPLPLALPTVWIGIEFLRDPLSRLFTGAGFTFLQIGLTQIGFPHVVQIADLGGTYAVSFVVVATNASAFLALEWYFQPRPHRAGFVPPLRAAAACGLMIAITLVYGAWRLSQSVNEDGPRVAIVSDELRLGSLDQATVEQSVSGVRKLLRSVSDRTEGLPAGRSPLLSSPDVVLWSELACDQPIVLPVAERPSIRPAMQTFPVAAQLRFRQLQARPLEILEELARQLQTSFVVGCTRFEHGPAGSLRFNSLIHLGPSGKFQGVYDKIHLAPLVEFLPPKWIVALFHGRDRLGDPDDYFQAGKSHARFPINYGDGKTAYLGVSICFDSCHSELYRAMVADDGLAPSDILMVATHEADDASLRFQSVHLTMARFRAIECRRAFCRASMFGYSAIVDGNGQILTINSNPRDLQAIVCGIVPLDTRTSLYALLGDCLPALGSILVGLALIWSIRRSPG